MPKVRPLGKSAQRAQRNAMENDEISRQIRRMRGEAGITRCQLAKLLGWDRKTLKTRTEDHPEKMTLEQIRQLEDVFEDAGVLNAKIGRKASA